MVRSHRHRRPFEHQQREPGFQTPLLLLHQALDIPVGAASRARGGTSAVDSAILVLANGDGVWDNIAVVLWLVKEDVEKWQQQGAHIVYRHHVIRDSYNAGNLKSAMKCSYVKDDEFVAIFYENFQPMPTFLNKTAPHFKVTYWLF
ncbi:Putative xyloglucan glycosyltransferase 10 [Linum perenne]